jgi:hypothetical protein
MLVAKVVFLTAHPAAAVERAANKIPFLMHALSMADKVSGAYKRRVALQTLMRALAVGLLNRITARADGGHLSLLEERSRGRPQERGQNEKTRHWLPAVSYTTVVSESVDWG